MATSQTAARQENRFDSNSYERQKVVRTWIAIFILLVIAYGIFKLFIDDALNEAAAKGDLAEVQILMNRGASVNGITIHGQTPLMSAARAGHVKVILFLLQQGADVNAANSGASVICYGIRSGKPEIVRVLLDHGADVHWQSARGETVMDAVRSVNNPQITELIKQAQTKK